MNTTDQPHQITLQFEDGSVDVIAAHPDETVTQSALQEGIRLLTDCLEGACATCKATCLNGDFELGDPSFDALSADEEDRGIVLLCQTRVLSDCVFSLPYHRQLISASPPDTHTAHVSSVELVGRSLADVRLNVEQSVPFLPGQYVNLQIPGSADVRSFSFANAPDDTEWRFLIRLLENGTMSTYLRDRAKPDDVIEATGPLGHFYLRPGAGGIVMVGGGTGVAPFLSMLAAAVSNLEQQGIARSIHIMYGAAHVDDLVGIDALQSFQTRLPQLSVQLFADDVSIAPSEVTQGSPVLGLTSDRLDSETDVYLCGPPGLIDAAQTVLDTSEVPNTRVFTERFLPSS
ncbi:MAG: FAD-binding oxidoreductase [Pseudomonadota bacterium]